MKLSLHKPLYLQEWQKLFPFFFFANCYIRSKVGFALKLLIEIVKEDSKQSFESFFIQLRFSFFIFLSFFKSFQQGNLDSQILPWIFKYVSICIIVGNKEVWPQWTRICRIFHKYWFHPYKLGWCICFLDHKFDLGSGVLLSF